MKNGKIPVNELDKAIIAAGKSKSALPRLLRALSEGELWFAMNYHPEVVGEDMEVTQGDAVPFIVARDENGEFVPIFSSMERMEESLKRSKVPDNTYAAGGMEALMLMDMLSKTKFPAKLNMGCATGCLVLPVEMMADVADGSALRPEQASGERMEGVAKRIDPADYPTDILQPLFEILRQHKEFRAAWVMDMEAQPGDKLPRLQFAVHMEPYVPEIFHEFRMVLASACVKKAEWGDGTVGDSDKEQLAIFWNLAQPFFVAEGAGPPES